MNKIIGVVGLSVVLSSISVGMLAAEDAAPAPGAKIYAAKCASCHGKDGKGNPAMAKAFKLEPAKFSLVEESTIAKSDADLIKATADGVGKMPGYKGKLTDQEIADVVAYSRSLAPKK